MTGEPLTNAELAVAHAEHARRWLAHASAVRSPREQARGIILARAYDRSAEFLEALAREGRWNGGLT